MLDRQYAMYYFSIPKNLDWCWLVIFEYLYLIIIQNTFIINSLFQNISFKIFPKQHRIIAVEDLYFILNLQKDDKLTD